MLLFKNSKIKLNVPLLKQKEGDKACGFICLQMILNYYGKKIKYNEIINLAKIDSIIGSWWAQMALVALKLGFKTELITYNFSKIYERDMIRIKNKKLIKRLEKQKKKN